MTRKKTVLLCVLDGWGAPCGGDTPVAFQGTVPFLDALMKDYPVSYLEASGLAVGLPEGQMGNSEVGHMNLGAGRVVMQDLPRIDQAITKNSFAQMPLWLEFVDALKQSNGTCHLMGLLSDGGVHAHIDHLFYLLRLLDHHKIPTIMHGFLDGRDTSPKSALKYLRQVEQILDVYPFASFGTLMGRYYGMDRDNRWDRTQKAFEAIAFGRARVVESFEEAIADHYEHSITDEFILPLKRSTYEGMKPGDGIYCFNYRSDRVRQILRSFLLKDFEEFERGDLPYFAKSLAMVEYADDLTPLIPALFPPEKLDHGLGALLSEASLRQMRIAETEKYAHVTFFFNGGQEDSFPGEDRCLVPSPKVATYDLQPEMSLPQVTKEVLAALDSGNYDFVLVNFANPDMVGHTGNAEAAALAMQYIDQAIQKISEKILQIDGVLALTADHGNIESMYDPVTKQPHTAHTMNPVPFILVTNKKSEIRLLPKGKLCDVAPTLLPFLHLDQPIEMTGQSLLMNE